MSAPVRRHWHFVTPEYPPDSGGIGDYCALVAAAFAARGDRVTVLTRSPEGRQATPGVEVVLLPDDFGDRTERALMLAARELPPDGVTLVQYVPQGFRRRGMNVPFARFLGAWPERLWLMVHEAVFPFARSQPARRWVLAGVTRAMLRFATRRAEHVFMSVPAWERVVERWGTARSRPEWLPIPSTLAADPAALVEGLSDDAALPTPQTVAHFGTYGEFLRGPLKQVLVPLLSRRHDVGIVLLGGRSERFRDELIAEHPGSESRVRASGRVDALRIGRELAAAGVVVFPFDEGVTTRRTSLMSALSVGAAIVTIDGVSSEDLWRASGAVSLYPYAQPELGVAAIERLLADPVARATQRERARELYRERFHLDRVVEHLQLLYDAGRGARR
jgi:glycosyltransferase involved in cell wall biosynthesis